jgi:hypothetical protein
VYIISAFQGHGNTYEPLRVMSGDWNIHTYVHVPISVEMHMEEKAEEIGPDILSSHASLHLLAWFELKWRSLSSESLRFSQKVFLCLERSVEKKFICKSPPLPSHLIWYALTPIGSPSSSPLPGKEEKKSKPGRIIHSVLSAVVMVKVPAPLSPLHRRKGDSRLPLINATPFMLRSKTA